MARPRKTSEELKASGAKPFKVAKRLAEEIGVVAGEEQAATKRGLSLAAFVARVKKERETFFERLDATQAVCKEYGADFNWRVRTVRRMAERVGFKLPTLK